MQYEFNAEIWLYDATKGSWCFVSLPQYISEEIKENFGAGRPGWGAIPVEVGLADVKWKTSIFPDTKRGVYLLPVKAQVRKQLGVVAGDQLDLKLQLLI